MAVTEMMQISATSNNNSSVHNIARGFTLIELLLAVTIASVVMAAVYATFSSVTGSQQRIDIATQASQSSRFFVETIRADIKNLAFADAAVDGNKQQLRMQVLKPEQALTRVSYLQKSRPKQNAIIRREEKSQISTEPAASNTDVSTIDTVVYEPVGNLEFRYLIDGDWQTEKTDTDVVPTAIEILVESSGWVQRTTVALEADYVILPQ